MHELNQKLKVTRISDFSNSATSDFSNSDVGLSGGTTCVWAAVRETNSGPDKVMTYVGGSGGILRQKLFEFSVSEMAFHAF